MSSQIATIKAEHDELVKYLSDNGEISFRLYIDNSYKKILLLSAASYFESLILQMIIDHTKNHTNNGDTVIELVKNKALNRQYHTLFQWKERNANAFFGLFGDATKQKAEKLIKDRNITDAERAFLDIGRERNELVHQNFVERTMNKTFDDMYSQYEKANEFVCFIGEMLSD